MKIKDIIVEQEKPGLLRRAAGAVGRGAYALTTGNFYPDDDLTPIEQIAKSATKNRSAVIKDAILQIQKRKIDTPEKFTQFYQSYFGGENPKLQASIQKKLQDLGRIDPNDTATVQQAITALTDERIKTLSKLAKGEFELTKLQQPSTQAPVQQPAAQVKQTTPVAIPKTTKAGVQLISRTPQIHLRYKKQDFFLKTDPSGIETFVNLAGKKVPDQTQEFLMNQLQQL